MTLTLAGVRLLDLALGAQALDIMNEDEENARVVRAVSDVAAGALRLAHLALEIHGCDVGYRADARIDRALLQADAELHAQAAADDEGLPVALKQVRSATRALANAARATSTDRMLVPDQVAEGLGHLLAIYAIAKAASASSSGG